LLHMAAPLFCFLAPKRLDKRQLATQKIWTTDSRFGSWLCENVPGEHSRFAL
jgi:hypothetical protein